MKINHLILRAVIKTLTNLFKSVDFVSEVASELKNADKKQRDKIIDEVEFLFPQISHIFVEMNEVKKQYFDELQIAFDAVKMNLKLPPTKLDVEDYLKIKKEKFNQAKKIIEKWKD